MKHWIVAALLLGGLTLTGTGCVIYEDDEPSDSDGDGISDANDNCPNAPNSAQADADGDGIGTECDPGYFAVSWFLRSGDANELVSCPDDHTIQVVSIEQSGSQLVDLFDCVGGSNSSSSGLTNDLPDGTYSIYINLMSPDDELVAQSALVEDVVLDGNRIGVVDLDFEFSIDRGSFGLTWTLTEGDVERTCSEVSADKVAVNSIIVGTNQAFDDNFACADGQAITPTLPIGSYTIAVSLHDGETLLDESLERQADIEFGNHFHDLGNFQFDLTPPSAP